MADNNRNQRVANRTSNQDWDVENERHGRNYDQYREQYERNNPRANRDYDDGGRFNEGRNDLNPDYRNYGSSTGRSENDRYSGSNYNYNNRTERDYRNYGNSGSSDYSSYNRSRFGRDLNDDYNNNDRNRRDYDDRNYGSYNNRSERDRNNRNNDDRTWWDRTTDEVSSWFGDEDAERRRRMDKINSHRGKGPKGYKRSDERIKEDINDRLSDDPFVDATDIEVSVTGGEVSLTGTVTDRSDKRRAEDIAEAVSGVNNVENRLRVKKGVTSENTGFSSGPGSIANSGYTEDATDIAGTEKRSKSNYASEYK